MCNAVANFQLGGAGTKICTHMSNPFYVITYNVKANNKT